MKLIDQTGLSSKQIVASAKKLASYVAHVKNVAKKNDYADSECSINCPFDKKAIQAVNKLVKKKVSKNLKHIVVIGIGGSNLGTMAVYDALKQHLNVEMIFVDTTNAARLVQLRSFLKKIKNPEEILLCSISKSGGTAETIANTEIVMSMFGSKRAVMKDSLVVITNEGSAYWQAATEQNIATLAIPELVGGRYSVLSSVGLFPLAAAGINIKKLLAGAQSMRKVCLQANVKKNPALRSAIALHLALKKEKTINDNFLFHTELESLGKWYRQLMGESVGKEKSLQGKKVHAGVTPTVSLGSTDLHSVGQLYLGGPKDKITTFIYAAKEKHDITLPKNRLFPNLVENISGRSAHDILDAILQGVKIAYKKKRLPFMEVVLSDISEESIGEFFQFKMMEMMYLGKLMNVNPFDQPNVENYKVETKRILAS